MADRSALLRDYCESSQPYREVRPVACSIEEEYELRKAAEEVAERLEDLIAVIGFHLDTRSAQDALAAWNALAKAVRP